MPVFMVMLALLEAVLLREVPEKLQDDKEEERERRETWSEHHDKPMRILSHPSSPSKTLDPVVLVRREHANETAVRNRQIQAPLHITSKLRNLRARVGGGGARGGKENGRELHGGRERRQDGL
jgi:hypothetical protein